MTCKACMCIVGLGLKSVYNTAKRFEGGWSLSRPVTEEERGRGKGEKQGSIVHM